MTTSADILFRIIRIALGKEEGLYLPSVVDWREFISVSYRQDVATIVVDGLQKIYDSSPNLEVELDEPALEDLKYKWFSSCLSSEQIFVEYKQSIFNLAKFYASQRVRMLLLKGYGLSLNYPIPAHRPVGDIDIFNFGLWEFADQMIALKLGIKIDETLKRLADNGERLAEDVFLPSADFNAIFLIRHLGQHMAGEKVTLRQLLDWGLFIDKNSEEINWEFVSGYWKEMGIDTFAKCINTICVKRFGIEPERFHDELSDNNKLCDRLLNDIVDPEFKEVCPNGSSIKMALFKIRRFFSNGWKRKLVYKESLLEMFITSSWAKMMKLAR